MHVIYFLLSLSINLSIVYGQTAESECPEKNGVFADSVQCDRYYECDNFVLSEKLCADGLVFADLANSFQGRCDFPFNVDCAGRPELRKSFFFFQISRFFGENKLYNSNIYRAG